MQSTATSIDEYVEALPADRQQAISTLRKEIKQNLPKGFEETMSYGMIGYVVPHKLYPAGYHCDPSLPLPFLSIASQKNFVAVYHMGVYAIPDLLEWVTTEFAKASPKKKLDMGKSCMRFKKMEDIPYKLIGDLAAKLTPAEWVTVYEKLYRQKK